MTSRNILIPDATNRPALTVIRSLGSRGCEVIAGAPSRRSLGVASRYTSHYFEHPPPAGDPGGFASAVAEAARRHAVAAILPAADIPASALLEHRDLLPTSTKLVLPRKDALGMAHDKIRLVELAESLGVPVPAGFVVRGDCRRDPRLADLGFPLVLKPAVSRYILDSRWTNASVRMVRDPEHLDTVLDRHPEFSALPYLVQEQVPGEGRGVFLLTKNGATKAVFAHRRIREKPPEGGVSTLCETAEPEPELLEYSERLLQGLNWSGVAMVEFKWDPDTRQAWLMEINGRFWGSMQLAVASGVDFPWLVYRQEVCGASETAPRPLRKCRLVWLPGDLDHFILRLRRKGVGEIGAILADIVRTRSGLPLDTDTLKLRDPKPFLLELARMFHLVS